VVDRANSESLEGIRRALRVAVQGVVQGVGFRPFVYRLAHQYRVAGWVRNTSWGVEMEVEADADDLARFLHSLRDQAPPLAHIESLSSEEIPANGCRSSSATG